MAGKKYYTEEEGEYTEVHGEILCATLCKLLCNSV